MTCCGHCRDAGDFFSEKTARKDLKRYMRRGPDKSTRYLLDAIRDEVPGEFTLLDIGGGIGTIQLELFGESLRHSVNVDASAAYQKVSRREAVKRGYASRVEYHFGDVTDLAGQLPETDLVTLDRVICCYPDTDRLLEASLPKAGKLYGLVFPREKMLIRIGFRITNLWFKIRKSEFRIYLHSGKKVDAIIRSHGFRQTVYKQTLLWQVMLYKKTGQF